MQDRRIVRGALMSGTPIEIVGEDRFDRAVGARADVDRPRSRGVQPSAPIGAGEPEDADLRHIVRMILDRVQPK